MYSNCYALQHAGQKSAEVAGRDRRGPSSKFKTFAGDDPYAAEELFECGVSNEPSSVDLQRFATLEAEDLVFEEVAMMRHKESTFKGHDAGQESGKIQRGCPLRSSRKMPLRRSMMLDDGNGVDSVSAFDIIRAIKRGGLSKSRGGDIQPLPELVSCLL